MYPNLKAEMVRHGVTCASIAKHIGRSPGWIENRLQGKASLPISVAISIRNKFFASYSYDYLFSSVPTDP